MEVSTLQNPVLLLDMFFIQGPERHLYVSTFQIPVLHLDISTPLGLELHLDLTITQGPHPAPCLGPKRAHESQSQVTARIVLVLNCLTKAKFLNFQTPTAKQAYTLYMCSSGNLSID
jgi:hypothetical protein